MKPKIALVTDVYNWVFDNSSKELKKHLQKYYDIEIIPLEEVGKETNILAAFFYFQKFDLIYFYWRGQLLWPYYEKQLEYIKSLGMTVEDFEKQYIKSLPIVTSVYDHLYIDKVGLENTKKIFQNVSAYTVCSKHLKKIYDQIDIKKPTCIITDGVDLNTFFPQNLERFLFKETRELVIGWVGNSDWQANQTEVKGVRSILKPAIQELIEEGYPVRSNFADKYVSPIPHDQMNDYYSQIDVYICTSLTEGTPNPVLEAAACGVPIISTDVGIVSDLLGNKSKKFILKKRNIQDVKDKIIYLLEHLDELKELSEENLEQVQNWQWKIKAGEFKKFFDKQLKKGEEDL